uniref:Myelin basic protein n=1 Tax=Macrostomum lignano TaxID=282301 RepID=A0A1I8IKX4_9PLAT
MAGVGSRQPAGGHQAASGFGSRLKWAPLDDSFSSNASSADGKGYLMAHNLSKSRQQKLKANSRGHGALGQPGSRS